VHNAKHLPEVCDMCKAVCGVAVFVLLW
jgi:hypothetical protein